ncbi:MAG TPA: hypothetical protein VD996_10990 [Chitinophagaceae bacterium]|nr:hypothetical protein [Chitinophagaceae bacterium]
MRSVITILLMLLLAFNWYGYRLLINYLQDEVNTELQASLDNNEYDESQLVTLRIPLNMPYVTDWNDFESYAGETIIEGIHYKYVKRKVERGELVLLCIPNHHKTTLEAARDSYFKLVNDLDNNGSKNTGKDKGTKAFSTDYFVNSIWTPSAGIAAPLQKYEPYSALLVSSFILMPSQPPET